MSVVVNGSTGVSKTQPNSAPWLTGMIIAFGNETPPDGWLACDGSAVSRTTYADLFEAIGVMWGAGDGSTTFNLPDMRETIPVGTGTRGSGVTAHDTYDVGEFKDDQMQQITGEFSVNENVGARDEGGGLIAPMDGAFSFGGETYGNRFSSISGNSKSIAFDSADSPDARTGTTSHGKQAGALYCIKT